MRFSLPSPQVPKEVIMARDTQPNRPRCDENPEGLSPEETRTDLTEQMAFEQEFAP